MDLQNFEKKLKKQEEAFTKKFDRLQSNFYKTLERTKQDAIDEVMKTTLARTKKSEKKPSLDDKIDPVAYALFDKKPYVIIESTKNSVFVLIPKFYPNFQVGWLKDEIGEYYRYVVNQYSVFFGDVPDEILAEIDMPVPIKANVSGNKITFDPKDKADVKRELKKFTKDWTDFSATITSGHEFDIIDQLLQSGRVPFDKISVKQNDLTNGPHTIRLRKYQKPSWNAFLKTGAIGVFHPTGAGKSFIGMCGLEHIKVKDRKNLIVTPKLTLIDQWNHYLETYVPHVVDNTVITTYQGFKNMDDEFGLTIFDECQSLPAPTFSRLSTIRTKYRMGLSATPFREDNRNHLIISLTGHPQNINWPYYMKKYGPGYHQISVHIVPTHFNAKITKCKELFNPKKRTMIYSYDLSIGHNIADKLHLPLIEGATNNRLEIMGENHSFVASSVFTEGVSIHDLDHIIEINFHFGSRREELQLTGRLMHSLSKNKKHDIIMTLDEFNKYKKRILALEEKGFHVKIIGKH